MPIITYKKWQSLKSVMNVYSSILSRPCYTYHIYFNCWVDFYSLLAKRYLHQNICTSQTHLPRTWYFSWILYYIKNIPFPIKYQSLTICIILYTILDRKATQIYPQLGFTHILKLPLHINCPMKGISLYKLVKIFENHVWNWVTSHSHCSRSSMLPGTRNPITPSIFLGSWEQPSQLNFIPGKSGTHEIIHI